MISFDYKYKTFRDAIDSERNADIVQRYILDQFPFCFHDNPEAFWNLRTEVCRNLDIHPQDVAIVGSAKLGFSLSPKRLGEPFGEASDIDLLIVSEDLFEKIWLELIKYRETVVFKLRPDLQSRFKELQRILFFGLLRMDKLSNDFDFAKKYWELFNALSVDPAYGPRPVRAAIYKSWTHACYYYETSIDLIRRVPHEGDGN